MLKNAFRGPLDPLLFTAGYLWFQAPSATEKHKSRWTCIQRLVKIGSLGDPRFPRPCVLLIHVLSLS